MTAPMVNLSSLGRAALKYAEHGWHVFPLAPRKKEPLVAKGFLTATNDVEQVRAWWMRHPYANIGLWPGQSGLVVLDLDGPDGITAAQRLGALSEPTLECSTGREDGGRHLYFLRPTFSVANCALAPKLDVRGDAGYVVLPPSVHPSGRVYKWAGRIDDVKALPPEVSGALYARQLGASSGSVETQAKARDVVFEDALDEGGRNNALTRYAGRLLAKQVPEDEVLILLSAMNTAKCKPPLPQDEVNAIVASIARKEATKAVRLVRSEDPPPPSIPSPAELAAGQIEAARRLLTRDVTNAPRWAWYDVDKLTGPMLPGDLVVVGALMGNGKSTLLMSQMDAFAAACRATLYIPLEVDPEVCRVRWAAWKLGLDVKHAIRQDWSRLPEGSKEAIDGVLEEQERSPFIHFATPKRMTFSVLVEWCRWAVDEAGVCTVMLDHFHRLEFGDASMHRVSVTDTARRLKDLARELGVVLIAAAQLNRASDPIDQYSPPQLGRLKESSGIGEEADVVLMLSRRLKRDLPQHWTQDLRLGRLTEPDLAEPNTMVVTCRKHRLDDSALNVSAFLTVQNGKLENRARYGVSTRPFGERP